MTADRAVVGSLVVYKPMTFRRSYKARIVGLVQTRAGLHVRIALAAHDTALALAAHDTALALAAHDTALALADARREGDNERAAALSEQLASLAELHALEQARWLADLHHVAPSRRPLPLFGALVGRRGSDVMTPIQPGNRRP